MRIGIFTEKLCNQFKCKNPVLASPNCPGDDDCRACHKYLRMACDLLVDTKIREKEAVWLAERINPAELCGGCTQQCTPHERGLCARNKARLGMLEWGLCHA